MKGFEIVCLILQPFPSLSTQEYPPCSGGGRGGCEGELETAWAGLSGLSTGKGTALLNQLRCIELGTHYPHSVAVSGTAYALTPYIALLLSSVDKVIESYYRGLEIMLGTFKALSGTCDMYMWTIRFQYVQVYKYKV